MSAPYSKRIASNPFYVLELSPHCSAVEVQRQGNKWLAMLELSLVEAESYDTPFGVRIRTADAVRHAMAQLQDPDRRLVHELWAAMDPTQPITYAAAESDDGIDGRSDDRQPRLTMPNAMGLFGWGAR